MASASHSRRPTGCRIAAAGVTRGGALHGARARADRAYRDWEGAIDVLWEDNYEAILEEQAACARHEEASRRQQLLGEQAALAHQQKAAALRQRLRLLRESIAKRERQWEVAALSQHRCLLSKSITEREQQREAAALRQAFASSARALLKDNGRPNLLHNENRRPLKPSSFGSTAAPLSPDPPPDFATPATRSRSRMLTLRAGLRQACGRRAAGVRQACGRRRGALSPRGGRQTRCRVGGSGAC